VETEYANTNWKQQFVTNSAINYRRRRRDEAEEDDNDNMIHDDKSTQYTQIS